MARSNRQLTQFAVDKLRHYLNNDFVVFSCETAGNTEVRKEVKGKRVFYTVSLFGEVILSIEANSAAPTVLEAIQIQTGDFYDSKGRPSRTTRERLNGLLDFLGTEGYLLQGTRVFLREDGICCVGKGDKAQAFDQTRPSASLLASVKSIPDSIIAKGLV